MHLPRVKERSWIYRRRLITPRKGKPGKIIMEMSLRPIRHRVKISGRIQPG